jgi:hypothetical protein
MTYVSDRRRKIMAKIESWWGVKASYPSPAARQAYRDHVAHEQSVTLRRIGKNVRLRPDVELPPGYLNWLHLRDFVEAHDQGDEWEF